MGQIATLLQSTDNARTATGLANTASAVAFKGGKVIAPGPDHDGRDFREFAPHFGDNG